MKPVKIAVTSDLHVPITSLERLTRLLEEIEQFDPDMVALAGDLAETMKDLSNCLITVRACLDCPILVIAGNHDLWKRDARSWQKWSRDLPELVENCGCTWLEGNAHVVRGIAVAGTIAWYDYSAADPGVEATEEHFAVQKMYHNMDAVLVDWEWTDPAFAEHIAGPFLETLDRLERDDSVRQTIVVTHMPLLECQMCRDSGNPDWAFSNAYFGNLTLGAKVLTRTKVSHVISGHTHIRRESKFQTDDGRNVFAYVLPSEYRHPAWIGLSIDGEPSLIQT